MRDDFNSFVEWASCPFLRQKPGFLRLLTCKILDFSLETRFL